MAIPILIWASFMFSMFIFLLFHFFFIWKLQVYVFINFDYPYFQFHIQIGGFEENVAPFWEKLNCTWLAACLCGIAKKKAAESVKKAVADAQRAGADVRLVRVHVGTKSWESLKAAMAQVQFDLQKEQAWRFRLQHEVKTLSNRTKNSRHNLNFKIRLIFILV